MTCRLCQGQMKKFLDLGKTSLPEEFRAKKELTLPVRKYPLNLAYCLRCFHIQLGDIVPADVIYKQHYYYDYSVTKTGLKHWRALARSLNKRFKLGKKDVVVDVGSNAGTLLSFFQRQGLTVLGVDPSIQPVRLAIKRGIPTINEYFTPGVAQKIVRKTGPVKLVTCTNTFDHVEDLAQFVKNVVTLLSKDGVFVIEVPYFPVMLRELTHVVYHQQIDYMTLKPLIRFFEPFNLEIFDCRLVSMHGGSARLFVGFRGRHRIEQSLRLLLSQEPILSEKVLSHFAQKIFRQRNNLAVLVKRLRAQEKTVAAIGASAKGITLLNYCGLDHCDIGFITEKSPLKIGLFTPSKIPVVADDQLMIQKPHYAIVLAWNFQEEIIKNLKRNNSKKPRFIIPIPKITFL